MRVTEDHAVTRAEDSAARPANHDRERRSIGPPAMVALACLGLYVAAAFADAETDLETRILFGLAVVSFGFVGAILASRVPGNVIGGMLLAASVMMSVGAAAGSYAVFGTREGAPRLPGVEVAALLNQVLFFYPVVIVLIGIPLVFPTGRLLSGRWRWLVWLAIVAMLALTAVNLFYPGPVAGGPTVNPLGSQDLVPLLEGLNAFASWTSVVGFGGAALSVVLRYRRGTAIERQQVKWLAAVAAVAAVAFPTSILAPSLAIGDTFFLLGFIALIGLPIAIAVAILRYRLYDIDRIISRTIGWGLVTGALLAAFTVAVLVLQTALARITQGQTLAVAASTLLAFAMFQPLRRRIQSIVDRRFDRARYDAEQTVLDFTDRLRDQLDLEALGQEVGRVAAETVRPESAGLWLRTVPDGAGGARSVTISERSGARMRL
jgi:hypothetical protein